MSRLKVRKCGSFSYINFLETMINDNGISVIYITYINVIYKWHYK